jgi:hypothetical protein
MANRHTLSTRHECDKASMIAKNRTQPSTSLSSMKTSYKHIQRSNWKAQIQSLSEVSLFFILRKVFTLPPPSPHHPITRLTRCYTKAFVFYTPSVPPQPILPPPTLLFCASYLFPCYAICYDMLNTNPRHVFYFATPFTQSLLHMLHQSP